MWPRELISRALAPVPDPERQVVTAAIAVRAAAIVMVAVTLPLVWRHIPRPGLALLVAAAAVIESLMLAVWWLRLRRVAARTLLVDLPMGVALLLGGAWIGRTHGVIGWSDFAYPYAVLIALTVGLACPRVITALGCGLIWSAAYVFAALSVQHQPLATTLPVVPAFLINPTVGFASARLLRLSGARLRRAREDSVREAVSVAMARERARHARALHDRVLQTLEMVVRTGTVADSRLRAEVAERAAWLRHYVESGGEASGWTGSVDGSRDGSHRGLPEALRGVAAVLSSTGVTVTINDAQLHGLTDDLASGDWTAFAGVVLRLARELGRVSGDVVVRVTRQVGDLMVSLLATGEAAQWPGWTDAGTAACEELEGAGGRAELDDATPYAELWPPVRSRTAAPGTRIRPQATHLPSHHDG